MITGLWDPPALPLQIQFFPNPEVLGYCWSFGSCLTLVHISRLGSADVFWDPLIPLLKELLPPRFSGPWLLLDLQDLLFGCFLFWFGFVFFFPPLLGSSIPMDQASALRSTQGPPHDPWRSGLDPCGGLAVDHRALGGCFQLSISRAQILWDLLALICIRIYLLITNPGNPWCLSPIGLYSSIPDPLLDPL